MFTKRKVIKKNVKKKINNLECDQDDIADKRVVQREEKKKGETNHIYTQVPRQNVELEDKYKGDGKAEKDKEKKKWEKYNKNKKEKKFFCEDRKNEEETKKMKIVKTSFLIYSENENEADNDNYIALKRKKQNKRFSNYLDKLNNKEMKKEKRNNSKNEHLKYISNTEVRKYSNKTKYKSLSKKLNDDKEQKEKDDDINQSEQNLESNNDEDEKSKCETTMKIHEHNFYLKLKDDDDDDDDVNNDKEETSTNSKERKSMQTGKVLNYYEDYKYVYMKQNFLKKKKGKELHFFNEESSVEKKETQNEEELRQQEQERYSMFIYEENNKSAGEDTIMVHFPDEKEENDEETNQLIEKIKIKKQILRKKNEMQNMFSNEFKEELNDMDILSNELKSVYQSPRKKLYLATGDVPNLFVEDDFEMEDLYNYETLNEMKNRLLIKKNKNEDAANILFDSTKDTKYNPVILSESDDENYLYEKHSKDEFFEKKKIEHIINKRFMADVKNELYFYEENQKEEIQESKKENERCETNIFCSSFHNRFLSCSSISNKSTDKDGVNDKDNTYESDTSGTAKGNGSKEKKRVRDITRNVTKREHGELDSYNKMNEKLFEKIQKIYKEKRVCNVQLVKMKKYITKLFNEYRNKQERFNQNENTESRNKEEYKRLDSLCKNQKNEIITCTIFMEFFHNMRNVIIEKIDLFHSALQVLRDMETTFHLIYQHLKLYMYKEFYEKYKFSFTIDYIFHLKYYKNKKENQKRNRLKKLEKKKVLTKNVLVDDTVSDFSYKIVEQVNKVELFNNLPVLYLFDGFSSNYSSDTSNNSENGNRHQKSKSFSPRAAFSSSSVHSSKEKNKNEKEEERKQQKRKQKYCQTLRMRQLKKNFLVEVNLLCRDVKPYFLNFKNVIKHFYILKCYKAEIFKKWKCSVCFSEILFFFVKWEILHWDPVFQFEIKTTRKKERILEYCKKKNQIEHISGNDVDLNVEETARGRLGPDSLSMSSDNKSSIHSQNESDLEKSEDDSFSLVSSEDSSGISSEQETENELESEEEQGKGDPEKMEGNKRETDRNKKKKAKQRRGESKKRKIKKKEIKKKDGKNQDKWDIDDKDIFPLFQNMSFRKAKYRWRKKFFSNPSIKSFEWYKFIDSIIFIYDAQKEDTILRQVYQKILNKRVYELIQVWNPFSLKQSANVFVLIKEFLIYNTPNDTNEQFFQFREGITEKDFIENNENNNKEKKEIIHLIEKVKAKMKECHSVILESCQHIDTLKKKSTFLMRCLKFFKSVKNILSLLNNDDLSEIVKQIYYNFVVTNYEDSVQFHNLIFASIIEILQCLSLPDDDFAKEVTQQWNKINRLN